ncbi:MAG: hypothetical protein ABMB14_12105 [Myxococcota bacterium]
MTVGPRRLNDDPDFKWETGCDLSDERGLVGDYDLAGLRSRLVAAAAASPAPGSSPEQRWSPPRTGSASTPAAATSS